MKAVEDRKDMQNMKDVKQEKLARILTDLDEDLLDEAEFMRQESAPGKKRLLRQWGAAAACLAILLAGLWGLLPGKTPEITLWGEEITSSPVEIPLNEKISPARFSDSKEAVPLELSLEVQMEAGTELEAAQGEIKVLDTQKRLLGEGTRWTATEKQDVQVLWRLSWEAEKKAPSLEIRKAEETVCLLVEWDSEKEVFTLRRG